jgi:hypothetical protein
MKEEGQVTGSILIFSMKKEGQVAGYTLKEGGPVTGSILRFGMKEGNIITFCMKVSSDSA